MNRFRMAHTESSTEGVRQALREFVGDDISEDCQDCISTLQPEDIESWLELQEKNFTGGVLDDA